MTEYTMNIRPHAGQSGFYHLEDKAGLLVGGSYETEELHDFAWCALVAKLNDDAGVERPNIFQGE